ncbi:MAG TPA: multicopper oxidase domain-containing protein, partial [Draconibacterium sp.]|nr:multicopper oxidase domain-containing protein [Draconibacterium sp.]
KKLTMAPGERADVIIDFSASVPGQTWTLTNTAKTPYPNGGNANPNTTGQVMQFVVNGKMVSAEDNTQPGLDKSFLPVSLRPTPMVKLSDFAGGTAVVPTVKRQLTLNEVMGPLGPLEALVNNTKWDGDGMAVDGLGITELPVEGTTELWQIINLTGDAHPIHLHLVQMQLVGRQPFNTNKYGKAYAAAFGGMVKDAGGPPNLYGTPNGDGALGGNPAISGFLLNKINPPQPNERGWKDTYIVYPGEVTTFAVRFAPTDVPVDAPASDLMFGFNPSEGPGYVWHCHIIDHEDNEMMRPYQVVSSSFRPAPALASAGLKSGEITASKIVDADLSFNLEQNYPNPGKYETEIRFQVPETMHVRLTLYNQLGQEVKVLLDNQVPKGNNKVLLNREGLTGGIYIYRLQAGTNVATKKMILQ